MSLAITKELTVGGVGVGSLRSQARALLGNAVIFRRTPESPETDHFEAAGLLLTYLDDRVTFIEIVPPATPTILGIELLGVALREALGELRRSGVDSVLDADGAVLPEWRVGLYAPDGVIEGVSLGE